MTDVQTLLRDAFRAHEHEIDGVDTLADAARTRAGQQRQRRARVAAVGVVVAVLAVTGGVALAINQRTSAAADVAGSDSPSLTPTDVPDGWRLVSNEGLEVGIPKSWPLSPVNCETPKTSTLIVTGGAAPACLGIDPPHLTVVRVERSDSAEREAPDDEKNVIRRAIAVSGLPATERISTLSDGRTRLVVNVPSRGVSLVAAGPDPALLERIAGTARVFDVDLNGCSWQVPDRPSWDRTSSHKAIDVGQPTSVTVCSYAGTLETSATLRGEEAASLVTALGRAKSGESPDAPAADCLDPGPQVTDLRIVLHGPGGDTPLVGHFSRCTDRYVASPKGVSQMTESILRAALIPLHIGWGFAAPLPAA